MKKYYLHIGSENSGPFDIEELISKKITKKTPVWFDGLENWKFAGEIEELNRVFAIIPSPEPRFAAIAPIKEIEKKAAAKAEHEKKEEYQEEEEDEEKPKIAGLPRNFFFIGLCVLILIIATLIFNNYQDKRDRELQQINQKTQIENRQVELNQKEIQEQNIANEEQQRLESERNNQQKKQKDNNRLSEIKNLISLAQQKMETAQYKFNDASGFKLFRTAADKKEQLGALQNEITSYKKEIEKLNNQAYQINLELEKTK